VLVKADPKNLIELAEFQALEGKTWNHPVVVGDRLYVRNAQEAACFRLPVAKKPSQVAALP
jgi:outer membrane protein assembly factor BamB